MDLMRARVALRERPLLDVLDLAVRFCAANASRYAQLALAVLLPAFAVSWGLASVGGWWVGWTAAIAIAAFADAPFVVLASRLVFEDDVRPIEVLRAALGALPRLIGVRMGQGLVLCASVLMLGVPWLYIGPALLFCAEVVVVEQARLGAAIGRAQRLSSARFGVALGAMALLLMLKVGGVMLADVAGRELLQGVLEVRPPPPMFQAGGSWLALLGWWSTVPLLATARFFAYLDIRTRSEGWDIQTRFAAIAVRASIASAERVG
jgi:hypothetical protein